MRRRPKLRLAVSCIARAYTRLWPRQARMVRVTESRMRAGGRLLVTILLTDRDSFAEGATVGWYDGRVTLADFMADVIAAAEAMAREIGSELVIERADDETPAPRREQSRGECSAVALNNAQDLEPSAGPPPASVERVRKTALRAQGEHSSVTGREA